MTALDPYSDSNANMHWNAILRADQQLQASRKQWEETDKQVSALQQSSDRCLPPDSEKGQVFFARCEVLLRDRMLLAADVQHWRDEARAQESKLFKLTGSVCKLANASETFGLVSPPTDSKTEH